MYKTVQKEIERLVKQTGISEDFLCDAAEYYEINDDGEKSTAEYIIRGLHNEAENYLDQLLENELVLYMDDEIRESLHNQLAPCSAETFLKAYIARDHSFAELLKDEFSIEL